MVLQCFGALQWELLGGMGREGLSIQGFHLCIATRD